jgi:hypothetical protein
MMVSASCKDDRHSRNSSGTHQITKPQRHMLQVCFKILQQQQQQQQQQQICARGDNDGVSLLHRKYFTSSVQQE